MFKLLEQVNKTGKLLLKSGDIELELDTIYNINGSTDINPNAIGIQYTISIEGLIFTPIAQYDENGKRICRFKGMSNDI